jgi:hypothetical protein
MRAGAGAIRSPADLVGRAQVNTAYESQEERPLPGAAQAAGVQQEVVLRRLGTTPHCRGLPQPFRVVRVATGKTDAQGRPEGMVLVTHRLDLDADLVALAYRSRWAVELFFRWVQGGLGCRHLRSQAANGVRIQV